MTASRGNQGCPCINTTSTLASLSDRHCDLDNGKPGIQLTLGGSCVPPNYGSSTCLQHDLIYDPTCQYDPADLADGESSIIPAYCFRTFCYVDVAACKKDSEERVFRSSYFPVEMDVDVFYSYSTCDSTADDWFTVEEDVVGDRGALGGINVVANVPTYILPMMFKTDSNGETVSMGNEYYDDSIPWKGVYIDYVQSIMGISNGDIASINITHRSKASSIVHPQSSYTAAVQDLQDGLADMGVGPFWITAQRLKMASFTLPLVYDKTFLVIPRPGTKDKLNDQIVKVLAPFSIDLWGLLLGIIFVAAMLSVWFSDQYESTRSERRMDLRNGLQPRRSRFAYARLALDSFLEKGLFFCSAEVKQDERTSLPNKLLSFGFGFFILISVSAYVANLAAFLTVKSTDDVKSMEGAIAARYKICAHVALKTELQVAWPDAIFYFHSDGNDFPGVLDDYDAGKCDVLAAGYEDTSMDLDFLERLCKRNLVYTDSVIVEIPIGFPIRSNIASGFSYWMYQGERLGMTLQSAKDDFAVDVSCNVYFTGEDTEGSEYDEIVVKNMFFPLVFFCGFALIAIILQIVHRRNIINGRESVMGRRSSLNLVALEAVTNSDGLGRKRRLPFKSMLRRLSSKYDEDDEDGPLFENGKGEEEEENTEEGKEDSSLRPSLVNVQPESILMDALPEDDQRRTVLFEQEGTRMDMANASTGAPGSAATLVSTADPKLVGGTKYSGRPRFVSPLATQYYN